MLSTRCMVCVALLVAALSSESTIALGPPCAAASDTASVRRTGDLTLTAAVSGQRTTRQAPRTSGQTPPAGEAAPTNPPESRDAAEVKKALDEVLSAPEYRHLIPQKQAESQVRLPQWLERLLDWLAEHLRFRMDGLSFWAAMLRVLLFAVALIAIAVVAALIIRSVWDRLPRADKTGGRLGKSGDDSLLPSTPPGELPADEYVRRAMQLAERGDYRGAIRQLLLGAMSWIERGGMIRYRQGLTNRDYVRAVWRRPVCRESLSAIVGWFERVYFGRRAATAEGFADCMERYRVGFASHEAVAQMVR